MSPIAEHRFWRIRRTWIDVSSIASRRDGILLYRPGRRLLRIVPWLLAKFAWLPWPSRAGWCDILPGFDLEKAIGRDADYVTIYIGNGSSRSKYTLLVHASGQVRSAGSVPGDAIVKVGRTDGAKAAIGQEYAALEKLQTSVLREQVPQPLGRGTCGEWAWSMQSVLPKGPSPITMRKEHGDFLAALEQVGMVHGDFAPWNCAIVAGRLVAWDWEDAGPWKAGHDEAWFRSQVKKCLGVDT